MRFVIILAFSILFFTAGAQNTAVNYIEKYDSLAVEILVRYQIPASLVLGVAMHESASGTSNLCITRHNHFGVKIRVKSKSGHHSIYRTFNTDEDAYLNFGEMIARRQYYQQLKGDMDYMKWLKAMKASGYARSSSWVGIIDKTIKKYGLTRFDHAFRQPVFALPSPKDSILRVIK